MDLQKVTLPLLILDVEHNDQKQALAHVLNQHDAGYVQPFILNSGDDTYEVPAEDFHFRASLPDNQIIDVDNSDGSLVEKGDQNWLLNLPTGVTGVPGLVKCVVYAKDNGRVLASSQQIMYNVMPAFDIDDVNKVSYVPDLDKLKANLQNLLGKAQDQVTRLSGITAGDKQAAEQALKEELDKLDKQAGDWLDSEKANVNKQIADIVKQSSGLDESYKQAYKEEIDKLAGQTGKDYEAKLQAVIDKLNSEKQASLQAINDDWTKQKGSLQTDIAGFKADLTKQVEAITSAVNALNTSDLPEIQAKVNSFKAALDKLNGQISSIKLDYYTKDEINNKLDDLKAGATPDLTDLKKQVENNTTSLQSKVGKDELANYALKSELPTAPDLTSYAKTADVNKELDSKADKTALDAYALKSDITQPDLTGYATTKALTDGLSAKADKTSLANYALKSELPAMPDLSAYAKVTALENYATKQALDAYALKTELPDLTGYAKKTDLPAPVDLTGYAKKSELPDVSNLETQADHANDVKKINETLETYAKKSELPDVSVLETKADHTSDVDKLNEALDSKADKTALDNYALKTDVPASPDLSGYAKKSDLPPVPNLTVYAKVTDVAKALNNKADKDELREYAKTADVEKANTAATNANKVASMAMQNSQSAVYGIQVDGGPLLPKEHGHVNLPLGMSNYLKKADADNEYAKKTDIPDISGLASKTDVQTNTQNSNSSSNDYYANVPNGSASHNNVYRAGKVFNWPSDKDIIKKGFTYDQSTNDHTWEGLFIGDKIKTAQNTYTIAAFNYYGSGNILLLADKPLKDEDGNYAKDGLRVKYDVSKGFNESDIEFKFSYIYGFIPPELCKIVENEFGDSLQKIKEKTSYFDGSQYEANTDSDCELMLPNMQMILGTNALLTSATTANMGRATQQLPLMKLNPNYIRMQNINDMDAPADKSYWLRDVIDDRIYNSKGSQHSVYIYHDGSVEIPHPGNDNYVTVMQDPAVSIRPYILISVK